MKNFESQNLDNYELTDLMEYKNYLENELVKVQLKIRLKSPTRFREYIKRKEEAIERLITAFNIDEVKARELIEKEFTT